MNVTIPFEAPSRQNSPKRVLVTGGAGFVGSHLCDRLLALGHDVLCVDNYHTGTPANISRIRNHERFRVIQHDITLPLYADADEIFNLACPASPRHYQEDPIHTLKTSVYGAMNMLGLAKRTGAKILQASTSEVYGDPEVHPQTEAYWGNVNPLGIRACYDEGKRAAETLFSDYRRQHGVRTKIARIFNTYGPRMNVDDGRVVSNFIVQALCGQPITIYGDGTQTRSFCYVDDMVEALVRLMGSPDDVCGGPVNLGNPTEYTILELAQTVADIVGTRATVLMKPLPENDPRRRKPDIAVAQKVLGWTPLVPLAEGLTRTIEYFEGVLRQADAHPEVVVLSTVPRREPSEGRLGGQTAA